MEARALLAKAAELETRHDGAAAIPAYERALALGLSPDERYRALLGLGGALRDVGRHPEAVQVFRVAIAEFPEMAAPHAHLALALHASGEGRQALLTLMDLVLRHVPLAEQEPALIEQRDLLARDPGPDERWRALAQSLTRKEFAQAYPFPFLYEISGRMRAALSTDAVDDEDTKVGRRGKDAGSGSRAAARPAPEEAFILPLRKVATTVPSAITFGRGNSNDVVLPDPFVSKVHAFLRRSERGWELADAGARNGAWIGGRRLDAKGAPAPVRSGDLLTFGRVVFFFLDAGDLWDRLHPRGAKP
ncbi:MAG TPA: tetratricopeptide repeat protein [Polyangia bacterium]|nr:tetratricopeptide repeat protein [Polyangia bacterium]